MSETTSSDEDLKAMRFILTIATGFGSLVGAIVGAILFLYFSKFLGSNYGYLYIYGAVGGMVAGGLIAFAKTRVELQRQQALHEAGSELGLSHPSESEEIDEEEVDEIENSIRELLPSDGLSSVHVRLCKQFDFATFVVAEVSLSRNLGNDHFEKMRTCTVGFFRTNAGRWPAFSMSPEETILERSGTGWEIGEAAATTYASYRSTEIFDAVFGDHDIDFTENPTFSRNYHLLGLDEAGVRRLFTPSVLDYFSENQGLCVTARGNQLMIYYPWQQCAPDDLPKFVAESLKICKILSATTSANNTVPTPDKEDTPDIREAANNMPGLMGHVYRTQLVTNDEVEQFLLQQVPRVVPANIKRHYYGASNLLLIAFGLAWVIGGTLFVSMVSAFGSDLGIAGTISKIGAILLICIGAIISWANLRNRFFYRRVLRTGALSHGVITDVQSTGTVVNNQAQYRLEVSLAGNVPAHAIAYGDTGRMAKRALQTEQRERFLADPRRPSGKVIWAKALIRDLSGSS